jgi:hypothetical protein
MKIEIVLKLIFLGPKNSESRKEIEKMIEKELEIGIVIVKECDYLVSYSEVFVWEDYFCIKLEYFSNGNLQAELDKKRIFKEEVRNIFYFILF